MDGATPAQAFRKVIAPLAAPGMVTAAILVFIFGWNDFLLAVSLTSTEASQHRPGGDRRTSPAVRNSRSRPAPSRRPPWCITIPIIIFVLIFQRRIVAGLTVRRSEGVASWPRSSWTR